MTRYSEGDYATSVEPRGQTAIDHAKETMSAAAELAERARMIADRLVGSVPAADPAKQGLKSVSSGILSDLTDASETARRNIAEGMEALSRIDRAI
jgi:hypothetical protein